jgi:hypothetical protein
VPGAVPQPALSRAAVLRLRRDVMRVPPYYRGMIRITLCAFLALVAGGCAMTARDGDCAPLTTAATTRGAVVHFVKLRSGLMDEDVLTVMQQRSDRFREVPGLVQKIYGREAETGEYCGIYIFESQEALDAFRQTELARTIREAYQVDSARIERFDVLFTLYPGVRAP